MSALADASHPADFKALRRGVGSADGRPGAPRWLLPLIVALAIALRLLAWRGGVQLAGDGADFLWQAQRFVAGDVTAALSHPFPPLYALLVAAVAPLTGDLALAGALVSVLAGALIVLAAYQLARLALPGRHDVACGAALLAALYQPALLVTSNVTGDGLFLALFLFALVLLFSGEQSGKLRLRPFGAGVLLGLAWLARTEALFLLLPVVLWLLAGLMRRESRRHRPLPPRSAYAGALALCLAGLALFVAPYSVLLHTVSGSWVAGIADVGGLMPVARSAAPAASPLGSPRVGVGEAGEVAPKSWLPPEAERVVLALGGRAASTPTPGERGPGQAVDADGTAFDRSYQEVLDSAAGPAPPRWSSRPVQRLVREGQLGLAAYTQAAVSLGRTLRLDLLLLVALGLPVVLRRRVALLTMLVLLLAGWLAIAAGRVLLGGVIGPRDLLGPALLVLPVAGAGLAWLWGAARYYPDRLGAMRFVGRLAAVLLVAELGLALAGSLMTPDGARARVEALTWVREHSDPNERIAVIDRKDAWEAQRLILTVGLPADEAAVLDEMQRLNVRLLVQRLDDLEQHAPDWLAGGPFTELTRFGTGHDAVVVLERLPG